jgi:hypothetical protein
MNILSLFSLGSKIGGLSPGGFLLQHWKWVAILVLALGIVADHFYLVAEVNAKEAKIQTLEKEKAACLANYNTINTALEQQNSLILMWAKVGKEQAARYQRLETDIANSKKRAATELDVIKKDPKLNTCQEALQYLFEAARKTK